MTPQPVPGKHSDGRIGQDIAMRTALAQQLTRDNTRRPSPQTYCLSLSWLWSPSQLPETGQDTAQNDDQYSRETSGTAVQGFGPGDASGSCTGPTSFNPNGHPIRPMPSLRGPTGQIESDRPDRSDKPDKRHWPRQPGRDREARDGTDSSRNCNNPTRGS